jgi:hypothetical protein
VVLAVVATGCVSAAPYRDVASAGAQYAHAVEALTAAAAALAVDASSERLLQDDALANVDAATLRQFDDEDAARAAVLGRIERHARLLGRYFALLGRLAAGGPGRETLRALDDTAAALEEAGRALRTGTGAAAARGARTAAAAAAGFYGRSLARRELARRAPVIDRELETHGEALAALAEAVRHDARVVTEARRQRRVVDLLLAEAPVADPDGWVAARRTLAAGEAAPAELGAAQRAAKALRDAVAAAAAGQPAEARIAALLDDLEAIRRALAALGVVEAGT